jgi:hypothetical protein
MFFDRDSGSKTSGVYAIRNKHTMHTYVGRAYNIKTRIKQHVDQLELGSHVCKPLQASWDTWGSGSFEFLTMFMCGEESLDAYEWFASTLVGPSYLLNVRPIPKRIPPPTSGLAALTSAQIHAERKEKIRKEEELFMCDVAELKEYLKTANIALFSRQSGVSQDTLHRWIRGAVKPHRRTLNGMVYAFRKAVRNG